MFGRSRQLPPPPPPPPPLESPLVATATFGAAILLFWVLRRRSTPKPLNVQRAGSDTRPTQVASRATMLMSAPTLAVASADMPAAVTQPVTSAPTSSQSAPAFMFLDSVVTDKATGARLEADKVTRGQTRLEVLHFKVAEPLIGLKRVVINYKHFPLAGFQKVGVDTVEMGSYEQGHHAFTMPEAKIPNMYLAKGRYKIDVTYSAKSHPGTVLTNIKAEFTVY